ncbi:hypothetical protein ACSBR2_002663 [Camellia fascicularis]
MPKNNNSYSSIDLHPSESINLCTDPNQTESIDRSIDLCTEPNQTSVLNPTRPSPFRIDLHLLESIDLIPDSSCPNLSTMFSPPLALTCHLIFMAPIRRYI